MLLWQQGTIDTSIKMLQFCTNYFSHWLSAMNCTNAANPEHTIIHNPDYAQGLLTVATQYLQQNIVFKFYEICQISPSIFLEKFGRYEMMGASPPIMASRPSDLSKPCLMQATRSDQRHRVRHFMGEHYSVEQKCRNNLDIDTPTTLLLLHTEMINDVFQISNPPLFIIMIRNQLILRKEKKVINGHNNLWGF